jgi:uncharacterized protein YndB with AHSA1/START domain
MKNNSIHMEDIVVIDAPIEAVFAYIVDFRNTAKWHKNMKKVGWKKDEPPGLGSEYDWTETFAGQTMVLDGVITSWEPPNSFAWRPTNSPYPISGGWTLVKKENLTVVTRYSDNQLAGIMKLMSFIMLPMAKRQVRLELQVLKRLIESGTKV